MCPVCTDCEVLWCFALHWECQSWAVPLVSNLSATTDQVQPQIKMLWMFLWNEMNIQLRLDHSRTIIDLGRPSVPTGLVSIALSATWWALYRSCLRSTWLWKRGCFLTGSSGPNCGETTLGTGVEQSEKIKGLNTDLPGYRWGGWTGRRTGERETKTEKIPLTQSEDRVQEKQSQEGENIY